MKALVVDDSKITRRLLAQILTESGYAQVVSAPDGAEGLEELLAASRAGTPFDVVVTDWRMPRMDGLAFLRAARAEPAGRDVPFVVISSVSDDEAVTALFAEGARNFIRKPFDPTAVRRALGEVARVERLKRESTSPVLAGTLAGAGVVELTQFMQLTQRTGSIQLEPDGRLDFDAGRLVAARAGGRRGEEAFFALVERATGTFRLEPTVTHAREIERPTTTLLFEALRRADERARPAAGAGRSA
jgi:CheY-like chemotaxis protein